MSAVLEINRRFVGHVDPSVKVEEIVTAEILAYSEEKAFVS